MGKNIWNDKIAIEEMELKINIYFVIINKPDAVQ
jgi:hypothetical protein